ncbi:MAG: DUF819 family protein [Saprospiraceae bacterium]
MLAISVVITIVTVVGVFLLQRISHPWVKTLLDWVPAILFAYLIPALITHLSGWDLSKVALHDVSKNAVVPFAVVCVMSALSFPQLRMIGFRPILLFVGGSFIIATLPVLLTMIFSAFSDHSKEVLLQQEYWKGLVSITGGWIGGSTSQLVLKELSGCSESIFLSILVLDNILVNIWTILMFQWIKRSDRINEWAGIQDTVPDFIPDTLHPGRLTLAPVAITLVGVVLAVIMAHIWVDTFLWKIILLSLAGLLLGNLVPRWHHTLVLKIGGIGILTIMAILGLKLNFSNLSMPLPLVLLAVVWLVLHFVGMLLLAWWLRLHAAWVPIASMANLGGISTAPAVTAAYNEEWMPHAILLAILSMVTGNFWGMVTIALFQWVLG